MNIYRDNYNIKWEVPLFMGNDEMAIRLIQTEHYFNGHRIDKVYGAPSCLWNGGRTISTEANIEAISNLLSIYKDINVSVALTFNSYNLSKEDLQDSFCNQLCDLIHDQYAIISSPLLNNHIKTNYPSIKRICSVIRPVYEYLNGDETPDYYNNLLIDFDSVVLRPKFAKSINFLQRLDNRDRIILIVNMPCPLSCNNMVNCYREIDQINRNPNDYWDIIYKKNMSKRCTAYSIKASSLQSESSVLSYQEIVDLYNMGFSNFKIQGRGHTDDFIMGQISSYIFEPTGYFQWVRAVSQMSDEYDLNEVLQ